MNNLVTSGSVSRIPITIDIVNKGSSSAELKRHLSPLSVRMIINCLPLQGRVYKIIDSITYIETSIVIGAEKQKKEFKRGEIAFMTSNNSICIFTKDAISKPMNPLGIVKSNLELIEFTQAGDIMVLKKL